MEITLKIPQSIYHALIHQAQTEFPNECVGMLAGDPNGMVIEHYPLVNELADPRRYRTEPVSLLQAEKQMRAKKQEFLAYYHSHPTGPAIPSKTDLAENYLGDVCHVIISLAQSEPELRAWLLSTDDYHEVKWEMVQVDQQDK